MCLTMYMQVNKRANSTWEYSLLYKFEKVIFHRFGNSRMNDSTFFIRIVKKEKNRNSKKSPKFVSSKPV